MATLFQMMTLFTALWLAQSCHPCQGAEDTADAETIIVFFIHIHIGGNAYTHKTFQRYLGQFKGRPANIWGRKDWQCPIASIQRGFNSWLAECSVNHCRNFLLFNHLCTFLGIGSSIWSGLPSVYCQVFLNAGSSLNQSLLYFPLSPAKYSLLLLPFAQCSTSIFAHQSLIHSFQSKCKTPFKIVLSLQLHIITTCDGAGSNPGLFWPELLGFPQKDKCAGQNTQNTSSTLHFILNRQWGVDIKQTCLVLITTFLSLSSESNCSNLLSWLLWVRNPLWSVSH